MRKAVIALALVLGAVLIFTTASIIYSPGPETVSAGPSDQDTSAIVLNGTVGPVHSAMFSKYVGPDTPPIIVDLDSGDPSDPLSLTIITPDQVLGPYNDTADGRADGRIYLKISTFQGISPGLWKFLVHSSNNISLARDLDQSLEPAGSFNHKPQE